jgi:CO/xanthine dehydrogenase Mo-binding subunit
MTGLLHDREFSRKTFLKGGGALVVGVSLFGVGLAGKAQADAASFPLIDPSQLDSWLAIDSSGHVTAFTGRVDQGQGKETAYGMTVAEELDVPFSAVTVVLGDTARAPNQGKSTATNGITTGLPPLRNAAAQARQTLLGLAATQLGVDVSQLSVRDGVVSGGGKTVSYGQLIGDKRFNVTMGVTGTSAGFADPGFPYPAYSGATTSVNVVPTAPLKDPATYKIVGTSVPRVDIPDKVTGKYTYTQNIKLPGMVHARMVMPPFVAAYPKVVPQLVAVKGFKTPQPDVQIVRKNNFVAVVAKEEYRAIQAAAELVTEWAADPALPNLGNINDVMRKSPNNVFTPTDSITIKGSGFSPTAGKLLSARYDFPHTTHGMIGPPNALASWEANSGLMTIWTGMQNPPQARADTAAMLGLPLEKIRVIQTEQASQFGRGGADDVAPAAAFLSMQVGKPVRLQWMRWDEHVWGPHMPGMTQNISATLGSNGLITSWYNEGWAPAAGWDIGYTLPQLLLGNANGLPHGTSGASTPGSYAIPNQQIIGHTIDPPVRPMYMRTVAGIQNTFIQESFMDELAAAAGVDSIQFRLNHLTDQTNVLTPVGVSILQAAQQLSGWQTRPSPAPQTNDPVLKGRGIGLSLSTSCCIAHVADVEVTRKTGAVQVKRISVVAELGTLVHPDSVMAQLEGGTIMGLSRAIKDEVTFGKNRITSGDWVTYPIVRFRDLPASIDIRILNPTAADNGSIARWTKVPNGGIGEPSSIAVPAAVANAVFDATGVRIRSTPFTPARVRAAMKAAGVA